jgi:2-amino-4-hydroxy-6-hydroxymethyldihydropteridine diphosphokinase
MQCLNDFHFNHHHSALVSVGSNMGDKLSNCRMGIDALTATGNYRLIKRSRFYQTEPVDFKDQSWFVNGVFQIRTDLSPWKLFEEIKRIERDAGRKSQTIRYGPRILDLDILLYNDQVIETEALTIPHPRMHKRRFVLKPVCDIDPNINHPVFKKTMGQLLKDLDKTSQEVILIS